MTNSNVNDLVTQKSYGGKYITSCSPSATEVHLLWPDGQQQTVKLRSNPTSVTHELKSRTDPTMTGTVACDIFLRGSSAYDDVLALLQISEAELVEARKDLEVEFKKRAQELETRRLANIRKIEGKNQSGTPACKYEPPHFDCDVCPDPVTNSSPRHFALASAFAGHLNGSEHKRLTAESKRLVNSNA